MIVYTKHYTTHYSPLGFYFATTSYDRTARVWSTDHTQPLRILAGHYNDVHVSLICLCSHITTALGHMQCLKFHPNGNYVATGSGDLSVRLWDVSTGQCVRLFTGHKVGSHDHLTTVSMLLVGVYTSVIIHT